MKKCNIQLRLVLVIWMAFSSLITPSAWAQIKSYNILPSKEMVLPKKFPEQLKQTNCKPTLPKLKAHKKAPIQSINDLIGPSVIRSLSFLTNIEIGGNSIEITKLNSTTLEIEHFTPLSTNKIKVNVDLATGNITIPSKQVLRSDEDGDYMLCAINDTSVSPDSPISGYIDEYGNLQITTGWADIKTIDDSYYYYEGLWRSSETFHANGKMKVSYWNNENPTETYNVFIYENETFDNILVLNFGNHGQLISIDEDFNNGSIVIPTQLGYDINDSENFYNGKPRYDYSIYPADWQQEVITGNNLQGTITASEIKFGNWTMWDKDGGHWVTGRYNDGRIYFNSSANQFGPVQSDFDQVIDGITYVLHPSTRTATIILVDAVYEDVVIPETVSYNGQSYTVTALAEQALAASSGFNYSVSFPSTITTIASRAFDNAQTSAVIWNSNTPLPSNAFSNIDSRWKNMLLYVNKNGIAPSNFTNTIVNGVIQNLELYEGYVFHCPQMFTANNVSFTHEFTMSTVIGKKQGWETIALPFDVMSITHATKGHLIPFATYSPSSSNKPFWLYEWSSNGFVKASSMQANHPYLISMPNNTEYSPDYNLAGVVTFSASNAIINTTKAEDIRSYKGPGEKYFFALYFFNSLTIFASINSTNKLHSNSFGYDPGSVFLTQKRNVFPFEGYIRLPDNANSRKVFEIEFAEDDVLGIDNVIRNFPSSNFNQGVFTISGQHITTRNNISEEEMLQSLPAGVYIVNGKKKVVK